MPEKKPNERQAAAGGIERTLRALLRSENAAARDLLVTAIGSDVSPLRLGAVRVLARRDDTVGHAALIAAWPELADDARAAVAECDARTRLRRELDGLIRRASPSDALNAAEIAAASLATEATAAVATLAATPDHPHGAALSRIALELTGALRRQVDRRASGADRGDPDPAFARRAVVNALAKAVETFEEHGQAALLEAMMLIAPYEEPSLNRALHDTRSPAHEELLRVAETSTSSAVAELLAGAMKDLAAPTRLLEAASRRHDVAALDLMFRFIGSPIGARVTENVGRVEGFAWLESEHRHVLLELSGEAQATAVQLAAASQIGSRALLDLVLMVLDRGEEQGRLEACRAIASLPGRMARGPLEVAVQDDSPMVAAVATKMLRKKGLPDATATLVGLLDHDEKDVRGAAQRSLDELTFKAYRDVYADLNPAERRSAGVLIGKADPAAAEAVAAQLGHGAAPRRLEALEMADNMGLAPQLVGDVIGLLADSDVGVRAEAARLLGDVASVPEVIDVLSFALLDKAASVRSAAEESLRRLDSLEVAQRLVEALRQEVDG